MAPPPKLKTLRPEDYDFNEEAYVWGPKLLAVLTQFCSDVTNALSRQLTRSENIKGETWEIVFTTGTSIAIDTAPFPLFLPRTVASGRDVWVTGYEDITNATRAAPSGAVMPVHELTSDGKVKVRLFTGLAVSRRYRIRGLME